MVARLICGCGRTSMPVPAASLAGPIWSKKMNGPIVVRSRWGRVRWTLNPPRSWVVGSRVWRDGGSSVMSVSVFDPFQHVEQIAGKDHFVMASDFRAGEPAPAAHHPAFEIGVARGCDFGDLRADQE